MTKAREIAELGQKLTVDASGNLGFSGDLELGDNNKAVFGNSSDLQIYHDGYHSIIKESGAGSLLIDGANIAFRNADVTKTYASMTDGGAIDLYHNNALKLSTTSTGVDITGDVGADTATITGKTTTDELDLSPIASTIADTAVDIFVYDTRKDSDGGAWRKRTQHTSWYNETLNTATRGSRKEFPSVAVIVAESNQVTIYDGDDPDLPMWMVFNQAVASPAWEQFWRSTRPATGVFALNGMLVFSVDSSSVAGVQVSNFVSDELLRYSDNSTYSVIYSLPVSGRNSTSNPVKSVLPFIVSPVANDVAMTVLPNAPIDAATGLPVPTIAVATDGGVSVITDSGAVYDSSDTSFQFFVAMTDEGVWGSSDTTINFASYSEITADGFGDNIVATTAASQNIDLLVRVREGMVSTGSGWVGGGNLAGQDGLQIVEPTYDNLDNSLYSRITSEFNTGWLAGNEVKLATLSDTDDTDVTGSELVTNGDGSSASGWNLFGGATGVTVSNGALVVTQGTTNYGGVYQAISVTSGQTYTISIEGSSEGDYSGWLQVGDNAGGSQYVSAPTIAAGSSYGYTFVPTQSTIYVNLRVGVSVDNVSSAFDNVSVRLAEEDRSVNGNGLQVFGTVTKNPVATGADLVAYTSDSTDNYLLQPYNSDLEFGTGDFCFMFWDDGTSGSYRGLVTFGDRGVSSTDGHGVRCGPTGNVYQFWANTTAQSSVTGVVGSWNHVAFVRKSGVLYGYLNGQLKDTDAFDHNLDTLTNPEMSVLYGDVIKSTTISVGVWTGNAALLRISATAPSPEQIAKIYEDEKFLFQENAQATLYGSSDAVTALAYDDSTEILSVGTSSGRSDFQGLRRVNNTTTGVTTSISASNGLIVEQ